jgi:hypothetical protein
LPLIGEYTRKQLARQKCDFQLHITKHGTEGPSGVRDANLTNGHRLTDRTECIYDA